MRIPAWVVEKCKWGQSRSTGYILIYRQFVTLWYLGMYKNQHIHSYFSLYSNKFPVWTHIYPHYLFFHLLTFAGSTWLRAVVLYSLTVLSLEFLFALALVAFSHVEALAFVLAGVVGAKAHRNLNNNYCFFCSHRLKGLKLKSIASPWVSIIL